MRGYARALPPDATLASLPEHPRFVFCATDLYFGVNFVFERERAGDYRLGYLSPPPADWHVARAVAASSCFPPVFNPLPIDVPAASFKRGRWESPAAPEDVRLSDGGLYDNLGLEPVWKSHRVVLVSDGGVRVRQRVRRRPAATPATLRRHPGSPGAGAAQAVADLELRRPRHVGRVLGNRQRDQQLRRGGIGYSKQLAREVIAAVRTDLDAFSDVEAAVLENHGYALAASALRTHVRDLAMPDAPPPVLPYPDWADETAVRIALEDSWRVRLLGRR